jgi:hypothetical protein
MHTRDPFTDPRDPRRLPPEIRYQQDPMFHALVDTLYLFIAKGEMTPTEVREAAILAAMRYEYLHVRPLVLGPRDLAGTKTLRACRDRDAAPLGDGASTG